jgi:hypothetical protein
MFALGKTGVMSDGMDGRGGLFVEVAGGAEGFKHQIM